MKNNNIEITEDLLASNNIRFVNHLLDLIPQYAIMFAISYAFYFLGEFTGDYRLNNYWIEMSKVEDLFYSYILMFIYYFSMESLTNRTLGKYVTKTLVVFENGEKPNSQVIAIRSLCRLIPFDAFSFLGTKGKGWHDTLSKTYVVDIERFEARKGSQNELDQIGIAPDNI